MYKRTSLRSNVFGFCVSFSGFYLIDRPSPVYVSSFFSLMFIFIWKIRNPKLFLQSSDKSIFLLVASVTVFQLISGGDISGLFHYNLSFIYFVLIKNLIRGLALADVLKQIKYSTWFLIVLLVSEAFLRISNPGGLEIYAKAGNENLYFYAFKMNSFMFEDSNVVSLLAMSHFFLLLYLSSKKLLKVRFELIFIFVLIALTLSRAATLVTSFTLILILFRAYIYRLRKIIFIFSPLVFLSLFVSFNFLQSLDGSLDSKFLIFSRTFKYIYNSDLFEIFLGNGFYSTVNLIGIGAHNIFTIYLLEIGLIGFFIFVSFLLLIFLEAGYCVLYLVFPFMFVGLSLTTYAVPYFFTYLAILVCVERSLIANSKRTL